MALKNLLGWVLCPWRWGESESGACSQAASLASGVCGPAVSHADRVPLRPPAQQSFPPGSLLRCNSLDSFFLFFLFFNYYCYNYCIPQQPSSRKRKISFTESSLYIASFHIGASPLGLQWTHLFIAATDCGEHWPKDAQTLSYTRL